MATITIIVDEITEADLQRQSAKEGRQASEYAARLLARAVRNARPRVVFDPELLKAYTAENAEEEALANSDGAHRAQVLAEEEHE